MWVARAMSPILDLIYPWTCAVCGAGFEGAGEGVGALCGECGGKLDKIEREPHCRMCTHPLPMERSPCPQCFGKGPANFFRVVRLGPYAPPLRELIVQLKYHKKWGIGEELADRLIAREEVKAVLQETQVLVAVPLHWKRRLMRWYNQAEVIARRLGNRCGITVARPVRRVRNTPTQTQLHSRAQREENLRGAFALRGDGRAVRGKHVTVIDDVWTTGATMQAVARVLKAAKVKSLSAIVVAAADPRGYERVDRGPELDE